MYHLKNVRWLKSADEHVDIPLPYEGDSLKVDIHEDESIESMKTKVLIMIPELQEFGVDGIYIFGIGERNLDTQGVFKSLRSDGGQTVSGAKLSNFIANIRDKPSKEVSSDKEYTYDDLIELGIEELTTLVLNVPIGTELASSAIVNPFSVLNDNQLPERFSLPKSSEYLLEYMPLESNEIMVCGIGQILEHARSNGINLEKFISAYFPSLRELSITTIDSLESQSTVLKDAFEKQALKVCAADKQEKIIQAVYNEVKEGVTKEGVLSTVIKANINPSGFPVGNMFKTLITSSKYQLTKYDPGRRRENLYRFYAPDIASDGRKVPALNKNKIFAFTRVVSLPRTFVIYLSEDRAESSITFMADGHVKIDYVPYEEMDLKDIESALSTLTKDVFAHIEQMSVMRGIQLIPLSSLSDPRIVSSNTHYRISMKAQGRLSIQRSNRCVRSLTALRATQGAIVGRYKAVAGYNRIDAVNELIVDMVNANKQKKEVQTAISSEFNMTPSDANRALQSFLELIDADFYDLSKQRLSKIGNPGIPIEIKELRQSSKVSIDARNIPNFRYINSLIPRLVSITSILQNIKFSSELFKELRLVCQGFIDSAETEETPPLPVPLVSAARPNLSQTESDSDDDDFFMSDDESTDSDVEDNKDQLGGTKKYQADLTGLPLSNPNPFSKRLQERQPRLFVSKPKHGFQSYSRSCPSNTRRQPVILTAEEKEKIDLEHPGSYDKSIKYKPYADGQEYYYICPRYWSLRENTSLTQEEVDSGKYGKLIPTDAKKVGEGETIYQFDSKYHRDGKGNYEGVNPGFMKPGKHPDKKCVPCCFKNWNAPGQTKLRKECLTDKQVVATNLELDEYVKGSEKLKLEPGRIGHLPIIIQNMFDIDSTEFISPVNPNLLKSDVPALVRFGPPDSQEQSFLCAIGSAYELQISKIYLALAEVKNALLEDLTIDKFCKLQNGGLIDVFKSELEPLEPILWGDSMLYKEVDTSSQHEIGALQVIQSAYKNYRRFIIDDSVRIDYEYCWDLVSLPNPKLFPTGVNLVILELPNDDVTSKVNVICPTTSNSSVRLSNDKPFLVLIKQKNLYQLVVGYEIKRTQITITRLFRLGNKEFADFTDRVGSLSSYLFNSCQPLPSLPNKYYLSPPVRYQTIKNKLGQDIKKAYHDYYGRIIALGINIGGVLLMTPIMPSTGITDLLSIPVDEYTPLSLSRTLDTMAAARSSVGNLPCFIPVSLFSEDDLVVGILTQTDQFIPVSPEIQSESQDLPIVFSPSSLEINKIVSQLEDSDIERERAVNELRLESDFYIAFRDEFKIRINKPNNIRFKINLRTLIGRNDVDYKSKMRSVKSILRDVVSNFISFAIFPTDNLSTLLSMPVCSRVENSKCDEKTICKLSDGQCKLLIPLTNLVTGGNNSEEYFNKLADELVRYPPLREFILDDRGLESLSDVPYNITSNELVLLQSLINNDYFADLEKEIINPYAQHRSFQLANPSLSAAYSTEVELDAIKPNESFYQLLKDSVKKKCAMRTIGSVAGKWQRLFPEGSHEIVFPSVPHECSFHVIRTILGLSRGDIALLPLINVKQQLINFYEKLLPKYAQPIAQIWYVEGKLEASKELRSASRLPAEIISSPSYFLSVLDILILSKINNLGIILYSSTQIPHSKSPFLMTMLSDTNEYYFVKVPGMKRSTVGKYRLLVDPANGRTVFRATQFRGQARSDLENIQNSWTDPIDKILRSPPASRKLVVRNRLAKE